MQFSVSMLNESTSQQLDTDLKTWLEQSQALTKENAQLWSPCLFSDASRKQASATAVTCLALDFDNGVSEKVRQVLLKTGLHHIWHTSASHSPETPKWRLVIMLDRHVTPEEWPRFWENAVNALGLQECDKACKNVGRFYFAPLKGVQVTEHKGEPLPVEEFLTANDQLQQGNEDLLKLRRALLKAQNVEMLSLIRLGLSGKPIASEGDRDNTVNKLGYYLGKFVVPTNTSPEAVCTLISLALPGDEPRSHWEAKFKKAFDRGYAERQEKIELRKESLKLDQPWAKQLQTRTSLLGQVVLISNTFNAHTILKNDGTYRFRKNLVEDTLEVAVGESEFRTFQDTDATNISNWLQAQFSITLSRSQVHEQVEVLASENPVDPLQDYLNSLEWDGVNRIDGFLTGYLGCADTSESRLYSRKWLLSLVARALRPGCKMDQVLVLQGAQGLGKSTALRLLTEPWFSDTKVVVGDKDSLLTASRFWMHEFAELASLKRADLETIKAFFTSVQDSYRPPYGRQTIVKPRRCVFVATTNESEFLTDSTGARRFWVVSVINQIDFAAIVRDRDQLLAEAVDAFKKGEPWWLESVEEKKLQNQANEFYQIDDMSAKVDAIKEWWDREKIKPDTITTARVIREIWNVPVERVNRVMEMEAGRCLRKLGFIRVRVGSTSFAYEPPPSMKHKPKPNPPEVNA